MTKVLTIEGMMCKHCAKRVLDALNAVEGVVATVDLESKTATCETTVDDATLTTAVTNAGYTVTSIK